MKLNALDQLVVSRGYAGAQFIQYQNTYRLPIIANGKAGDLTIDTGAPSSVIFKATLKKFGLSQTETDVAVHGVFGQGKEKLGLTTIRQLAMGNCTLMNVKALVVSTRRVGACIVSMGFPTVSSASVRCSNTAPSSISPIIFCWSIRADR